MFLRLLCPLAALLACSSFASGAEWGYAGSRNSPDKWGGACKGNSQSPVDLPRFGGQRAKFEPFK